MLDDDAEAGRRLAAVTRLQADYSRFVDDRDGEALAGLYAAGGALVLGDREIGGERELAAFAAGGPRAVHSQGVPSIRLRPDGDIDAVSSFTVVVADTGAILAGRYTDRMTWEDGRLLFARRHVDIRIARRDAG
ncbi:nuclear transport factor 2 family protein [Actinomadura chokoriensis]|uniref:Nuclear transport factor 2 family protein n=1 Tax=Actinomadura chokoriensis TaxID=454156 RepID=A0ABV4QTL1_9ACTN